MTDRLAGRAGIVLALVAFAWLLARVVLAEGAQSTTVAIRTVQPRVSAERAERLAAAIDRAAAEHGHDPRLLVALVMRESSFDPRVERGERLGAAGELGLCQVHPRNGAALALRPDGCNEDLQPEDGADVTAAECQIATGAAWLAAARERCPGSPWRWVGAYGSSRCPSEEQAGVCPTVRRAWSYCQEIGCEWR